MGVTVAAAIVTAMTGTAAPALATTEPAGGGTWSYGVSLGVNYSDYYHPTKWHKSSVRSGGVTRHSGCAAPGTWSHATISAAISGNKAYWDDSC
ncbi:hypothetical protein GCM10023192_82300 [Amycolatopsis samaneae]